MINWCFTKTKASVKRNLLKVTDVSKHYVIEKIIENKPARPRNKRSKPFFEMVDNLLVLVKA